MSDTPALGTVRELLRECAVVVKPGEALVVRFATATPGQLMEAQAMFDFLRDERGLKFDIVAVPGDQMIAVQAETEAAFARRVAAAQGKLAMRDRFPLRPLT